MKPATHVPPTVEELKERFNYDPETGVLRWINPPRRGIAAGSEAGTVTTAGYFQIKIKGYKYYNHRVIWAITYGEWPRNVIDHINGVAGDNRLINLRAATVSQNGFNSKLKRGSMSGFKGVSWSKRKQKWVAQVHVMGARIHVGFFTTKEAASAARSVVAQELHQQFYNPGVTTFVPASAIL